MMNRRNKIGPTKLKVRLNLSPPSSQASEMSLVRSPSRSNTTSPSSCVSSETNQEEEMETTTSMVLVGCTRCLMYVMLSEDDPKCPKCKSTVLLNDFLHHNASTASTTANTRRNKTCWN